MCLRTSASRKRKSSPEWCKNSALFKNPQRSRRLLFAVGFVCVVVTAMSLGSSEFQQQKEIPAPRPKQRVKPLQSPREASLQVNTTMEIEAIFPIPSELNWTYDLPIPRDDTTFIIHRSTAPNGPWIEYGRTRQPPFKVIPSGFYRIETINL